MQCGKMWTAAVLLVCSMAFAVTWQMDSSPFTFPAAGVVQRDLRHAAQGAFRYTMNAPKGILTFHYVLPAGCTSATLRLYRPSGALVGSTAVPAGGSFTWRFADEKASAGVYVAALRFAGAEKKIAITIVK